MTVDNHLKCRTYPLLATNIYFTMVTMGCATLLMYIYSDDNRWWCHPIYNYGGHSCYYFASAPSLPCQSGFKGLGWLHSGEAKDIKWEVNPTSAYTATTTPTGECWPTITMAMTTLDNPSYVPQPLRSYPQPTDNPWYVPTTRNPPPASLCLSAINVKLCRVSCTHKGVA